GPSIGSLSRIRSSTFIAPTRSAAPRPPWPLAPRRRPSARPKRRRPAPMVESLGFIWSFLIVREVVAILVITVVLLFSVAYFTYWERKVLAWVHLRKGPNVVGPFGLLQPIADGLKLFMKETVVPTGANRAVFIAAPILTFVLSLVAWAVIPFDFGVVLAD